MTRLKNILVSLLREDYPLRTYSILFGIFFIALTLRMYGLGHTPEGLHFDEVANAYGTKFILKNGVDLYGNPPPVLYLDKFGDYPPVLPMYLSGLGASLFGDTEFGARFFIALVGSLIVFPTYIVSQIVFRRKTTSFIIASIVAFGPWHVALSRVSAEGIVGLTIFVSGLAALYRGLQKNSTPYTAFAIALFLLTYFIYPSYRIVVPLVLSTTTLFILSRIFQTTKRMTFVILGGTCIAITTLVIISQLPWGQGRFDQTGMGSPMSGVQGKLQQLIFNEDSVLVARIFNNKFIGYAKAFMYQYSRYFSFNYLFDEDGIPKIYSTPYMGLLYLSILPLIGFSVWGYIQKKNQKIDRRLFALTLIILFMSPIPAALTVLDVPSIQRALLTPYLVIFIAGYGLNGLLHTRFKKVVLTVFGIAFFLESIFFIHQYFQHASYYTNVHRNPGNKEAVLFAFENKNDYESIYITNQEAWLPTYYLFFTGDYRKEFAGSFGKNFRLPQIDNVVFPEMSCPTNDLLEASILKGSLVFPDASLIIEPNTCDGSNQKVAEMRRDLFQRVHVIKRLDETEAFYIYKIKSRETYDKAQNILSPQL